MDLSAQSNSLTWAYQRSLTASHELISSATQPNISLSAPPFNLTWANQQLKSVEHGLISTAFQPNMGLTAALLSQPNMG